MTDQGNIGIAQTQPSEVETTMESHPEVNTTELQEHPNTDKAIADDCDDTLSTKVPPLPAKDDDKSLQQQPLSDDSEVIKTNEEREKLVLKQEEQIRQLKQENEQLKAEREALKLENDELRGKFEKELKQRDFEMKELRERQNAQIQDLENQLRKLYTTEIPSPTQTTPNNTHNTSNHQHPQQTAPSELYYGSCVMDDKTGIAYFRDGYADTIFTYNQSSKHWTKLPSCPNKDFALVIVDSLLTAVGGYNSAEKDTNKLFSFTTADGEDDAHGIKRWVKIYPPMPTKRYTPAATCTETYLIVVGGSTGEKEPVSKVEVMNIETQTWWLAHSLPYHVTNACVAVNGDNVFVVGGMDTKKEWLTNALSCSLKRMVQSAQSATLGTRFKRGLSKRHRLDLWQQIADVPTTRSTSITVNGQLIAIGGDSKCKTSYSSEVYEYKPSNDSWEVVGNLTTPRARCLAVSLSDSEVFVVGGYTTASDFKGSDSFETVHLK